MTQNSIRDDIISAFPNGTGDIFYLIWYEVGLLHIKSNSYRSLYGEPDRIELVSYCSQGFFVMLQRVLFENLLITIARLTDPEKKGTNENISLYLLISELEKNSSEATRILLDNIWDELDMISKECQSTRNIRNKIIAHSDKPTLLGEKAIEYSSFVITESLIFRIGSLVSRIQEIYMDYGTNFHLSYLENGDAEHLIFFLQIAKESQEKFKKTLLSE